MNKQFLPQAGQVLLLLALVGGCVKPSQEFREKAPRPVTTITLAKSAPPSSLFVSGAVKSWKTEQIGFEVGGRVKWVLEPGENIRGHLKVEDKDGNEIKQRVRFTSTFPIIMFPAPMATRLAEIDSTQYEIARDSAKASRDVAELEEQVKRILLQNIYDSELPIAEKNRELAQTEYDRIKQLWLQNAISQSELDEAENRLETQKSRVVDLESSQLQAKAELSSAEAESRKTEEELKDAERDLANTTLYASYPGQISEVHVVPGSVVSEGSPVLTLQMMDPIKVEVEVSAEQSREIQRRRQVPIEFAMPAGSTPPTRRQNAFVYMVDPSADLSTRTFTVTLLIINEQYRPGLPDLPDHLVKSEVARTQDIWPLRIRQLIGVMDTDAWFIEESCIESLDKDPYVWLVEEVRFGEELPDVVNVKKYPVTLRGRQVQFLGNWTLLALDFDDPSVGANRIVAGALEFPDDNLEQWDGQSVVVDQGPQWRLRPGDLVEVNLSDHKQADGYFVPVESIYEEMKSTYVFVVDGDVARKTEVKANLPNELDAGSMVRIEPRGTTDFATDTRIVLGGVHYLNDGEKINVVSELDINPATDLPAPEIPTDDSPSKTSMTGAGERP